MPVGTMQIGVCTSIKNAATVKAAGAHFVEEHICNFLMPSEPDSAFATNLQAARAAALPLPAANCFLPPAMKCVGPDVDTKRILEHAETAFRRAHQVGMQILVFGSGVARMAPEGFSTARAFEQYVELLKLLGPVAARHSVTMVVEPLNRGECNIVNSVTEGAEATLRCGHPSVRLLADIYHMLLEDEPPAAIVQHGTLLAHVHVAEKADRASPGTKGDDFRPYLKALRNVGYDARIAMEPRWKDFAQEVTPGVTALHKQLRDVGYSV
jgi:sugar phosphate isomerase/epimerase